MAKLVINFSVIITITTLSLQSIVATVLIQEKCSLQDTACLTKQARLVLRSFVEGNPELGMEKLDKMSIDFLKIKKYGLNYEMKNLEVEGLKSADIDKVSIDMDLKTLGISFKSSLTITGDYTASGVLFTLPVSGDGEFEIKINDTKIEMLCLYDIVKNKDGYEIMNLTNYIYGFSVTGDVHYRYENVYNNVKEKKKKLHSLLNGYTTIMVSKFGDYYISKITEKIFTAVKVYLTSQNLKDLATY
ncbi:uncharacterized protein [Maniola hyperantus]|uniref:uncharacterized protein n=1 Tax=Aphantopus hyperantus TaxID=2795564 RepID=UPI003748D9B2